MLRHGAALWTTVAMVSALQLTMAPGCVCRDSMRYVDLPPNSPADIEVLRDPPQRPFKIIGKVMITGATAASWQRVMEGARQEAASMRADAITNGT